MPVQKGHLLQSPHVDIIVDNVPLSNVISVTLSHELDKARTLSCSFKGDSSLLQCRLGAIVSLKQHIGKPTSGTFSDDNSFLGIIKTIQPSQDVHSFIAFDFTTLLAESQLINYKVEDYIVKIPRGDRTGTVIEPMLTDQWFVAMTKKSDDITEYENT